MSSEVKLSGLMPATDTDSGIIPVRGSGRGDLRIEPADECHGVAHRGMEKPGRGLAQRELACDAQHLGRGKVACPAGPSFEQAVQGLAKARFVRVRQPLRSRVPIESQPCWPRLRDANSRGERAAPDGQGAGLHDNVVLGGLG